jgi:hypothetical protein
MRWRGPQHFKKIQFLIFFKFRDSLEKFENIGLDEIFLIIFDLLVGGWTQNLLHFYNLNAFSFPWEHWRFGEQLENDAACGPDVDRKIIFVTSQNKFWRPVVPTDHIRSIHAGRTQVQNLARAHITYPHTLIFEQNIFRFQISVGNTQVVHVFESDKNLSGVLFDGGHWQELFLSIKIFEHIFQRHIAKFEHSILDNPLLFIQGIEKVKQLHDILFTSEHIENFEFSGDDISCFLSPFEGDFTFSVFAKSLKNVAKSAISDHSDWG